MGAMQVAIHGKQDIGGEKISKHLTWGMARRSVSLIMIERKIVEEVQVLNGDRFCRCLRLDFYLNEMEAFNYDLQFKGESPGLLSQSLTKGVNGKAMRTN